MRAWTSQSDHWRPAWARLLLACALALVAMPAIAHKSSDAYLFVQDTHVRADFALRDLDAVLVLDTSGDGQISWGEVKAARTAIASYVQSGLVLDGCTLRSPDFGLESRPDGTYAVLHFDAACSTGVVATATALRYTLFADIDPTHRAIARVQDASGHITVRLLDPQHPVAASVPLPTGATPAPAQPTQTPPARAEAPAATASQSFVLEGLHHILGGFDHVLFLICLLLPAVMRRDPARSGTWMPLPRFGTALVPVVGMVTMFTVAHSVTLALAAFQVITLPASVIEPAIALTIIATAVDNIRPVFRWPRSTIAFAFGLVHGFGFADVLAQLALPRAQFAWALLQFNVGLELGQLAIVLCAVTLLYLLRERPGYPRWVIHGGSTAALLVGAWWLAQRVGVLDTLAT